MYPTQRTANNAQRAIPLQLALLFAILLITLLAGCGGSNGNSNSNVNNNGAANNLTPGQPALTYFRYVNGFTQIFTRNFTTNAEAQLTSTSNVNARDGVFNPDGSQVYFDADNGHIYRIGTNITSTATVTVSQVTDGDSPVVSRDGKMLIFDHNGDIIMRDLTRDPGDENKITTGNTPDISPDGLRLAFQRDGMILIRTLSTGVETTLTSGYGPQFSPDGTRIVFFRYNVNPSTLTTTTTATSTPTGDPTTAEIFIRSSQVVPTVAGAVVETAIMPGVLPTFTPDGTQIVFNQLETLGDPASTTTRYGIYAHSLTPDAPGATSTATRIIDGFGPRFRPQ